MNKRHALKRKELTFVKKAVAAEWPLARIQAHLKNVHDEVVEKFVDRIADMGVEVELPPINKMNAKELQALITKDELDVDLSDYSKIAEKREAVQEAVDEEEGE